MDGLPNGAAQLGGFAGVLRANGFAVAPEQTVSFLDAVGVLAPTSIEDVRVAAHAVFAPQPERRDEFDALFRAYFHGEVAVAMAVQPDTEQPRAFDASDAGLEAPDDGTLNPSGEETSRTEHLSRRDFVVEEDDLALRRFRRDAPRKLPRRRGYRMGPARRGARLDIRKALRSSVRDDGDVREIRWRRRKARQRNVLVLIDVSGSMKAQTDAYMRFAHVVTHAADRVECFTFGTRLTRVTRALRTKSQERALQRAAETVADWDGGTRIGEALQAFLSVPRFAGYARGALVVVLSDGLERGDTAALNDAVARLTRRAWRIVWLSPLAAEPGYSPETAALREIIPLIDVFDAAGTPAELYANALRFGSSTNTKARRPR